MSELEQFIPNPSGALDQAMLSFPPTQAIGQLRNQYLEEMLSQQIATGCKQVVMLGAGLDIGAGLNIGGDRLTPPDVHYFEIGQAALIESKLAQQLDRCLSNTTYIASNPLQPNLIELLQHHEFDVQLPTYFVWAGCVPTLNRGDTIALIDTLRNQVRQFHLSFDYPSHQLLDRLAHDPELTQTLDRLEYLGISWITVFKDIAIFTKALGLELLDTCTIAQLHAHYCPQSSLPSALLHCYCICTIAKQPLKW